MIADQQAVRWVCKDCGNAMQQVGNIPMEVSICVDCRAPIDGCRGDHWNYGRCEACTGKLHGRTRGHTHDTTRSEADMIAPTVMKADDLTLLGRMATIAVGLMRSESLQAMKHWDGMRGKIIAIGTWRQLEGAETRDPVIMRPISDEGRLVLLDVVKPKHVEVLHHPRVWIDLDAVHVEEVVLPFNHRGIDRALYDRAHELEGRLVTVEHHTLSEYQGRLAIVLHAEPLLQLAAHGADMELEPLDVIGCKLVTVPFDDLKAAPVFQAVAASLHVHDLLSDPGTVAQLHQWLALSLAMAVGEHERAEQAEGRLNDARRQFDGFQVSMRRALKGIR